MKVENDTDRLFQLMMYERLFLFFISFHLHPSRSDVYLSFSRFHRTEIREYQTWESELAPRIIVGLWHPKFITPAQRFLPSLRLSHIGMSTKIAREYFWDACDSFSLSFSCLLSDAGERFRRECREAGKALMVWTVNRREEMIEVRIST